MGFAGYDLRYTPAGADVSIIAKPGNLYMWISHLNGSYTSDVSRENCNG